VLCNLFHSLFKMDFNGKVIAFFVEKSVDDDGHLRGHGHHRQRLHDDAEAEASQETHQEGEAGKQHHLYVHRNWRVLEKYI